MNPFEVFLTQPILNVLILFYKIFDFVHLPWALGFAIIFLTVAVRLALWPLTTAQLKSTQKMAALKPHLDQIKKDHGHDKARHQQEVSRLYKEHGVNPLAGCLPLILQIPVFIALYNVLLKVVEFGRADFLTSINEKLYYKALYIVSLPDTSFLGFNLAAKPNDWRNVGITILLIPIITGVFQFIQSKMLMPAQPAGGPSQGGTSTALSPAGGKEKGKESLEDTMASMQSQMAFIMPLMIAFFSYGFPVGLSLYWNVFTIMGIIQQYQISGPGGIEKYLPKIFQK